MLLVFARAVRRPSISLTATAIVTTATISTALAIFIITKLLRAHGQSNVAISLDAVILRPNQTLTHSEHSLVQADGSKPKEDQKPNILHPFTHNTHIDNELLTGGNWLLDLTELIESKPVVARPPSSPQNRPLPAPCSSYSDFPLFTGVAPFSIPSFNELSWLQEQVDFEELSMEEAEVFARWVNKLPLSFTTQPPGNYFEILDQ